MAFMKWLSDESVEECSKLVEFAGDAAHVARNHLCGVNNASFPELLVADTLAAQIEAISRDVKSLLTHRFDCTMQLRNATKCAECSIFNLDRFFMNKKDSDQCYRSDWILAKTRLKASKLALTKVSRIFVTAVTGALASSLGMSVDLRIEGDGKDEESKQKEEEEASVLLEDTPGAEGSGGSGAGGGSDMMMIGSDLWYLPEIDKSKKDMSESSLTMECEEGGIANKFSSEWLGNAAQKTCNAAHRVQGEMSSFIRVAGLKDTANKLIALCGQSENMMRNVQAAVVGFEREYKTHPDCQSLWNNTLKAAKKQAENVRVKNEEIERLLDKIQDDDSCVTLDFTVSVKRVRDEYLSLMKTMIDQIVSLE